MIADNNTTKTPDSLVPSFEFPSFGPLRIAIVGAGSIGLYYGVRLAEAGCDVHFLMRSGFEEAKSSGIRVHSPLGDSHLQNPKASRSTEEIGCVDCVVVSIKATANLALEKLLPPLLGNNTAVITLQNGLGNEEFLSQFIPRSQIMGALCFDAIIRSLPTTIQQLTRGSISIGEFSEKILSPRVKTLVTLLRKAGVKAKAVLSLTEERWRKLVWNIPFNGLAVVEGVTVDRVLATPYLLAECMSLMEETIAAANALGVPIESDYQNVQLKRTFAMGPYRPSTLVDFQAGKKLEIEAIWGIPLHQAKSANLEMPHLSRLYDRLCELNPVS